MSNFRNLFHSGLFPECERDARTVIDSDSRNLDARLYLCLSLLSQSRYQDVVTEAEGAIQLVGERTPIASRFHQLKADAIRSDGRMEEAIKSYQLASDLDPARADAHHALAQAQYQVNRFDECQKTLERVFALQDLDDNVYSISVFTLSMITRTETAAGLFSKYPHLKPKVDNSFFFYGIGNLLVRDKQPELALQFFDKANQIKRLEIGPYQYERELSFVASLRTAHEKGLFSHESESWEEISPKPIFIVGMPRTGSSLLEQMLGAHSDIKPLGEVGWLWDLFSSEMNVDRKEATFVPEEPIDREMLLRIRAAYLEKVSGLTEQFVLDKTLVNYYLLWLIKAAFPEAIILHTYRDKGPTVFSCYKSNFKNTLRFSESLIESSQFYDEVEGLIRSWSEDLGSNYVPVSYEGNIDSPESTVREILSKLELPFQDACLNPSGQKRIVETASKVQVTQPIYERANQEFEPFRELIATRLSTVEVTK